MHACICISHIAIVLRILAINSMDYNSMKCLGAFMLTIVIISATCFH